MKGVAKYILGVAAKSNVEKRQVGCIITCTVDGQENIVSEGFNSDHVHAEEMAILGVAQNKLEEIRANPTTFYVTHAPCPECARLIGRFAPSCKIEVVEAFMKFDTDKLRYDLIDPEFWLHCMSLYNFVVFRVPYTKDDMREALYEYAKSGDLKKVLDMLIPSYANLREAEDGLAAILTFGASKYKPNNWRNCADTGRYLAACHRHNNAKDETDPETNRLHKDHMLTNIMFLFCLGFE